MDEQLKQLKERIYEISDLGRAMAVLGWDQQTYMPAGGAEDRGDILGTMSALVHSKATSDEMGRLIEDLKPVAAQMDPDSDDARLIKVVARAYEKGAKVPTEHVAEFSRLTAVAHENWARARATNNFAAFQPYLERIVAMRREYAAFFKPFDHVYDPLLDDFEPGLKTAEVQAIFGGLRSEQVELIKAISESKQVNDDFLHVNYPEQGQWDFGVDVVTRFGYDWNRGRQDKSAHPFTTSFGIDDVRITTRFDPERSASALFSTMHEAGHAMYEQGIDHALRRTPLADGASMAIHESQSRLWENLVGRSRAFWTFFFPRLKDAFPTQLAGVDLETFYKGINKVEPSLIRVEADEATYNLHIMLRLELEIALMEGSLEVKDLPAAWNQRVQDYLGITPPNDSVGVLQDVHWSGGMIGYFPTYALGNLVSAQWWEVLHRDIPDLDEQIAQGKFDALLGWLRQNIHRHGSKFEPQELVQRITGSKIDAKPYVRYLKSKYSEIYGL